ncbi:MAG TPA: hypothetical protein VJ890_23390 [Vineibacter sp.]|nr:hypothetical protein [Vineibacter sp.]
MDSPTMRFIPEVPKAKAAMVTKWSDGMSGSAAHTAGARNANEAAILLALANATNPHTGLVRKTDSEVIHDAGLSLATGRAVLNRLWQRGLVQRCHDTIGASGLMLRDAAEILVSVVKADDKPKTRAAHRPLSSLTGV